MGTHRNDQIMIQSYAIIIRYNRHFQAKVFPKNPSFSCIISFCIGYIHKKSLSLH